MKIYLKAFIALVLLAVLLSTEVLFAAAPLLSTTSVSNRTATSAQSGGHTIGVVFPATQITQKGVVWDVTSNPTTGSNLGMTSEPLGSSPPNGTGNFSSSLTALSPETNYHVRAYAIDATPETGYGGNISFYTLSANLDAEASNFIATGASVSQIDLSWTGATFPGSGATESGYLIYRNTGSAPVVTFNDGSAPSVTTGTLIATLANTATTYNDNNSGGGLSASTRYYYLLIPYTYDGSNAATYNFGNSHSDNDYTWGPPIITTTAASLITTNSAQSGGNIVYDGNFAVTASGIVYGTSSSPAIGGLGVTQVPTSPLVSSGSFTSNLTPLSLNTEYFIRSYATNSEGTSYGSNESFYTLVNVPNAPTVDNPSSSTLDVAINVNGNPASTEFAIRETVSGNYVQANGSLAGGTVWQNNATWGTSTVTGLSPNTSYTFEVKARNGDNTETIFSSTASDITLANVPAAPTVNNATSSTLDVAINVNGNPVSTEFAIRETASGNYVQANGSLAGGTVWQNNATWGTITVTGLSPNTSYTFEVKARNSNSIETIFGSTSTLSTLIALPTLTTSAASSITGTSAQSGGNISDNGGDAVIASGIVYGTNSAPVIGGGGVTQIPTSPLTAIGSFTSDMTGLIPVTTYYVRSYATNGAGTAYGNEISFLTTNTLAEISTDLPTNIDFTSATSGGNVIDDKGFPVTERGIVYNEIGAPSTADTKITDGGSGLGSFVSNITGLTENQVYFIRSYAISSQGTAYGNEVSFATIPTLGEWGLIALGSLTAMLGGWFVYRRFV